MIVAERAAANPPHVVHHYRRLVGERSYGHNFKLSGDEKRAKKIGVLTPWPAKQ
jgi:hypothetical protein